MFFTISTAPKPSRTHPPIAFLFLFHRPSYTRQTHSWLFQARREETTDDDIDDDDDNSDNDDKHLFCRQECRRSMRFALLVRFRPNVTNIGWLPPVFLSRRSPGWVTPVFCMYHRSDLHCFCMQFKNKMHTSANHSVNHSTCMSWLCGAGWTTPRDPSRVSWARDAIRWSICWWSLDCHPQRLLWNRRMKMQRSRCHPFVNLLVEPWLHSSQLLEGICTVCSAKQVVIKQFVQCIGKSLPIVRSTSVHGEHPWRGGVQRRAWCIPFSCLRRIVSHRRSCPSRYISTTLTLLPVLTFLTRKLVRIWPKTGARRHCFKAVCVVLSLKNNTFVSL